jgi:hypothetical protein
LLLRIFGFHATAFITDIQAVNFDLLCHVRHSCRGWIVPPPRGAWVKINKIGAFYTTGWICIIMNKCIR